MPIPGGLLDFISCRLTSSTHPWPRVTAHSGTVWNRDRRQLSLIADFLAPYTEKDSESSSKLSRGKALWCHWSGKRCVLYICHLVLGSLSTQVLTLLDFRDLILSSTTSNILDLLDFFFFLSKSTYQLPMWHPSHSSISPTFYSILLRAFNNETFPPNAFQSIPCFTGLPPLDSVVNS